MPWKGLLLAASLAAPCLWAPAAGPSVRTAPGTAACGDCHQLVLDEWQGSAHATAFTDPVYQQALAARAHPERCLPCHAPDRVLDQLGRMPRARADRREDGIRCIACHQLGDTIHGPRGGATDAHATAKDAVFGRRGSLALCRSCHDTRIADVLPLAGEFVRAGGVDDDESCVGCHMERITRPWARDPASGAAGASRPGRSHRLLGPTDVEFCATALRPRVETRNGAPELVLANGAGHGVPGLARLRTFRGRATLLDGNGRSLGERTFTISSDDRLLADEERRIPLSPVAGAIAVRVEVDHHFAGKRIATVIDRTLELP